jgi:hypothetical protein
MDGTMSSENDLNTLLAMRNVKIQKFNDGPVNDDAAQLDFLIVMSSTILTCSATLGGIPYC